MTAANPSSTALMKLEELAQALIARGCPPEKSAVMAGQLDRRAKQLAEQKRQTYTEAMTHLLGLMKQGWAAPVGILNSST